MKGVKFVKEQVLELLRGQLLPAYRLEFVNDHLVVEFEFNNIWEVDEFQVDETAFMLARYLGETDLRNKVYTAPGWKYCFYYDQDCVDSHNFGVRLAFLIDSLTIKEGCTEEKTA
jgi:hypothetical protein